MSLKLYTGLSLLILMAIFTLQNVEIVEINFLIWKLSISRALMIFLVLSIGIIIGWLIAKHYAQKKIKNGYSKFFDRLPS